LGEDWTKTKEGQKMIKQMSKQTKVGFLILAVGVGMFFFDASRGVAPFLVGFSLPTIIRGVQEK
jgi:hypothetical protein